MGRRVGEPLRERAGQLAGRARVAEEDGREGGAESSRAAVPGLQDRRRLREPGHVDGGAGDQHRDGARVRLDDAGDEVVLVGGQREVAPVGALVVGERLVREAGDEDDDVGAPRGLDRAVGQLLRLLRGRGRQLARAYAGRVLLPSQRRSGWR